jgi:hypothetical protein
MHDLMIMAIPTVLILAGILFNNNSAKDLRSEMKDFRAEVKAEIRDLRTEMKGRFDVVDAELRYFHGTIGKLEARVDAIEKRG